MLPGRLSLILLIALAGCRAPDPGRELEISEVETYWVLDAPVGQTLYMAPALRFRVSNRGKEAQASIQATAVFRRVGESEVWGTDWQQVTAPRKPLLPNESMLLTLRSDGRYYSTGAPDTMFTHAEFKDAEVEVFLRSGSSGWVKMDLSGKGPGKLAIDRRIGAKSVQQMR
jgi:hypothetical protein